MSVRPESAVTMHRFRPLLPLLVFGLLAVIPLWKAIVFGHAIGPFDQIRQMAPWNGPKPSQPWDVLQADGVLQFYPWRDMVLDSWGKGQLPLWNPRQLAGTPLLANSQSGGFYPPHVLLGLLHVPTAQAMTILAWFHLMWAGLGCFVLARRLGASEAGGYLSGSLFCLSPFMVAWVVLPSVISTVSWIPWCLWAVGGVASMDHSRLRNGAHVGFAVAMMILAGHLQFVAYGLLAVVIFGVGQLLRTQQVGAKAIVVVAGLVMGILMAAPQLIPAIQFSKLSHRQSIPTEEGYAAYSASAIQPWEFVGLGAPNVVGLPTVWAAMDQSMPSYWPEFLKRGDNFAESAVGIGAVGLALLFVLPFCKVNWRRSLGICLVGLVGFLLATGTILGRILYFLAPGWSSTGSPGRAGVLFVLAVCVLCGVVASSPSRWETKGYARYWPIAIPPLALVAVFLVLPSLLNSPYFTDPKVIQALINTVVLQMLPTAAFGAVLSMAAIGWWASRRSEKAVYGLCGAAVVSAMTLYALVVVPASEKPLESITSNPNVRIAAINDAWEIVAAAPALLPPNTASAMAGVVDLSGYDSLLDRGTVELLRKVNGQDPAPPANGNMMFIKPTADPKELAAAGVSEVWSLNELPQFGNPRSVEGGLVRYSLDSKGRVDSEVGSARIIEDGYDHQVIQATGPGVVTVKDRNMEGWSATINGQRAQSLDPFWRSVRVPEGEHQIRWSYSPPGLMTGLWLGLAGWLGLGVSLWLTRKGKSLLELAKPAVE